MRLPSPALVIAVIALFVALGGTSYAVTQLPRNSVGTTQLKTSAVTSPKLKAGAVTSAKVAPRAITTPKLRDGAVTSAKIKDGSVDQADLSAGVASSLKGAATSAYAFLPDALFDPITHPALDTDDGAVVLTGSITTTTPARLTAIATINATANVITASANERYSWSCVVRIRGADAGPHGLGSIYLHGGLDLQTDSTTATGSAEVAAGTHTATLTCQTTRPDAGYIVLSRPTMTLIATPR